MSTETIAADLAKAMIQFGTYTVFGVPGGGSNLDIIGAVEKAGGRFVLTHTEAAATIMAGVAAELTGRPSAAVATRGPGVASAVNGTAQALLDRQPILLVTDCVTATDRDRISHQRLDQVALMRAVTKASIQLGPTDTITLADMALRLALSDRPGPVHVEIDPNGQSSSFPVLSGRGPYESQTIRQTGCDALRLALRDARRPVVVAGIGSLRAVSALRQFVEPAGIPVLTTYKARGVVADSSLVAAGVATGATIESPLLHRADLILGVGLDPVELIPAPWPYEAPIALIGGWAVDDSSYFGAHLWTEVVGDVARLLDELAPEKKTEWALNEGFYQSERTRQRLLAARPKAPNGVAPQDVITRAREVMPPGTIATVDAGAHMLLAVPLWKVDQPGELLISSGLATMGFALPAAIAAAVVRPGIRFVCFTGDGGLSMVLAELETLARLNLPVIVVVFNDSTLSLIAIKQRSTGQGGAGAVRYSPIDYAAIGAGCRLTTERVRDADEYEQSLRRAMKREGPTLIDVIVDPSAYTAVIDAVRGPQPAEWLDPLTG